MFKNAFEDEIYRSMEKQLVANQDNEKQGMKKMAQAINYLAAAASILDQAGLTEEAFELVEVAKDITK